MSARLAFAVAVVAACAGLGGRPARACDACVEDKIAATYDWQVISKAREGGNTVVFAALVGRVAPGEARRQAVLRSVDSVPGIAPGSARVSLQPPAVSFVFDPRRIRLRSLVTAVDEALRGQRLVISIVRVGAPGQTPASTGRTRDRPR